MAKPPDLEKTPLRQAVLAGDSIVRFDRFTINGTIFPERKEQPESGKFELYDAMRFLEIVYTRPNGDGGRQVRLVPWAHVAQISPMDDGK